MEWLCGLVYAVKYSDHPCGKAHGMGHAGLRALLYKLTGNEELGLHAFIMKYMFLFLVYRQDIKSSTEL